MQQLKDRERKVDVNQMVPEAVEVLSKQIGEKIRSITDEAAEKVNAILKIYGMSAKMAISFDGLTDDTKKKTKTPKKRSKKATQDNLK